MNNCSNCFYLRKLNSNRCMIWNKEIKEPEKFKCNDHYHEQQYLLDKYKGGK